MLDKAFLDERERQLRAELERGMQEQARLVDALKRIEGALLFLAEVRQTLDARPEGSGDAITQG